MKIIMFFDQIQAGLGGKERNDLSLGASSIIIGAGSMIEPHLDKEDKIIACFYSGDKFFSDNEEKVINKVVESMNKLNPDIVILGPSYNYPGYSRMCAILADNINTRTKTKAIAAMSKENTEVIEAYKDKIHIVKMPKKGGTGLTEALENIIEVARITYTGIDKENRIKEICY